MKNFLPGILLCLLAYARGQTTDGWGPCDSDTSIIGIKTWDELVHRVSSEYHDANPSEPLTKTLCPNTIFYVPNTPGSEAAMYRGLAHIECGIGGLGQDCIIEGGIVQFRIWGFSLSADVDTGAKFRGLTFRGAKTAIQTEEYINHAGEFVNCTFEENSGNRILDLEASLFGVITFSNCIFRRNVVSYPGGLFYIHGIETEGMKLNMNDCKFEDNDSEVSNTKW
eukprot:scaffold2345_cov51-Attheya_sp.AAC.1